MLPPSLPSQYPACPPSVLRGGACRRPEGTLGLCPRRAVLELRRPLGTGAPRKRYIERPYITCKGDVGPPPRLWRWQSDSSGVTPWSLGTPGLFSLPLASLYMRAGAGARRQHENPPAKIAPDAAGAHSRPHTRLRGRRGIGCSKLFR